MMEIFFVIYIFFEVSYIVRYSEFVAEFYSMSHEEPYYGPRAQESLAKNSSVVLLPHTSKE